jgi:hypothetical protein
MPLELVEALLWIGNVLLPMRIQIRLSFFMPIRIRKYVADQTGSGSSTVFFLLYPLSMRYICNPGACIYLTNGVPSACGLTGISMLGGCVRNCTDRLKNCAAFYVSKKFILQSLQIQCFKQIRYHRKPLQNPC